MAFYDWNKNGKKDFHDDFIEYNIYKKSTENNNNSRGFSNESAGCFSTILMVGLIAIVIILFAKCSESTCAVAGCEEKCTTDSEYCFTHDYNNRHYGSPTHINGAEYKKDDSQKSTSEKSTYTPSEKSTYTPSKKTGSSSNSKSTKSKSRYSDPYNVNDYSDPEDFYEDNYDDFWEYEEAEEYYNEHYDD